MTGSQEQSTSETRTDRRLLRTGGFLAIVGALLATVSQAVRPTADDPLTPESYLHAILDFGLTAYVWDNVGLLLGWLAITLGLVALAETFRTGRAALWARFGRALAIAGFALVTLTVTVSGVAVAKTAQAWDGATGEQTTTAFEVFAAVWWISHALFAAVLIVTFGLTMLAFGLAVVDSDRFPSVLGVVTIISGPLAITTGVLLLLEDIQTHLVDVLNVLLPLVMIVTLLWVFVLGVLMWRTAPDVDSMGTSSESGAKETDDAI